MSTIPHSTFLCTACNQEKDFSEQHKASRLHFILCKPCAAVGKFCPICETYKTFNYFDKDSYSPKGTVNYCKACRKIRNRERYDPTKKRAHKLQYRFQLTQAEYDAMLQDQGGVCAICKQPETAMDNTGKKVRALAVDYDHETGAVRQLLCGACNYLLGIVKDNADILQAASDYLKKHNKPFHE
jgi:hypothetical protein